MKNDNLTQVNVASLLADADFVPSNLIMRETSPIDNTPALSVGKDIVEGQVIAGFYEGSKAVETKRGTSTIHYIRLAKNNVRISVWGKAVLNLFLSQRQIGEFVKITYKGLGVNADGNDQHFFEFETGSLLS